MSNETKWDVFEVAMNHAAKSGWVDYSEMMNRYDAALPDDLPVIPQAVGEYLKTHRKDSLGEIFWKLGCKSSAFLDSNEHYTVLNSEIFARAWLLGAWRVEETGEIVKLIK